MVPRHEPPFDECVHSVWLCSISIDASCCTHSVASGVCTAHEVVAFEPLSSVLGFVVAARARSTRACMNNDSLFSNHLCSLYHFLFWSWALNCIRGYGPKDDRPVFFGIFWYF